MSRKGTDALFSIKQEDEESLWRYMSWFKPAMLEVHNPDHWVTMSALKKGIKDVSLSRKFSHDFSKLLAEVDKYIAGVEGMAEKRRKKMDQKRTKEDHLAPQPKKQNHDRKPPYQSWSPWCFENFLPLNAPWR